MPTFNWVFDNQPIASGISRYKRADEKGTLKRDPGSCLVIHLFLMIYSYNHVCIAIVS